MLPDLVKKLQAYKGTHCRQWQTKQFDEHSEKTVNFYIPPFTRISNTKNS